MEQVQEAGAGRPERATLCPQRYLPEKFYTELMELLREHGRNAIRQDKIISHETMDARKSQLVQSMRELRGLGYKLESPHNLKQRHVEALAKYWESRHLSPSTISNRISVLRALALWIGKAGMIQKAVDFVADPETVRRTQATTRDKSWSGAGLDVDAMLGRIEAFDARVGLQSRLMNAFGLRKKEAVMFRPLKADLGTAIRVRDGTKGGRERVIPIVTEEQRNVLALAQSRVRHVNQHIGNPELDLKQALRRVNYVFERLGLTKRGLGVTAHGLRHEDANGTYERLTGVPSPVRDPARNATTTQHEHDVARARVSQNAGHNRLNISNAYIGARPAARHTAQQKAALARYKAILAKDEDQLSDAEATELGHLAKIVNAVTL